MKFEVISAGELDRCVENGQGLVIDLRSPDEYRAGHIRGAVNLPYQKGMPHIPQCLPGSDPLLRERIPEHGSSQRTGGQKLPGENGGGRDPCVPGTVSGKRRAYSREKVTLFAINAVYLFSVHPGVQMSTGTR